MKFTYMSINVGYWVIIACFFVYLVARFFLGLDNLPFYNEIINPLCYTVILMVALFIFRKYNDRVTNKKGRTQTVIIVTIIYLMVYFALGLLFTYERNPLSREPLGILSNFYTFGVVIVLQEIVRNLILRTRSNKKIIFLVTTIFFILVDIQFGKMFLSFQSAPEAFKYIFGDLLPIIVQQSVYSYISLTSGIGAALIHRLAIKEVTVLLPILPKMDWFINGCFQLISYTLIYLVLRKEVIKKEVRQQLKEAKPGKQNKLDKIQKKNYLFYWIVIPLLVLAILFQTGVLGWRPIAVMSNSMYPLFSRGDAAIVRQLNETQITSIKVGDVIEYQLDSYVVLHRVIEIQSDEENSELLFITQGDHNNAPDNKPVKVEQVRGLVKAWVPFIGWPAVRLTDLFSHGASVEVETGDN